MIWMYNPNFKRAIIQINPSQFFYILLIAPSISFSNESIVWRPPCIFLCAHKLPMLLFIVHYFWKAIYRSCHFTTHILPGSFRYGPTSNLFNSLTKITQAWSPYSRKDRKHVL